MNIIYTGLFFIIAGIIGTNIIIGICFIINLFSEPLNSNNTIKDIS